MRRVRAVSRCSGAGGPAQSEELGEKSRASFRKKALIGMGRPGCTTGSGVGGTGGSLAAMARGGAKVLVIPAR
jgi:hypothetical protein